MQPFHSEAQGMEGIHIKCYQIIWLESFLKMKEYTKIFLLKMKVDHNSLIILLIS